MSAEIASATHVALQVAWKSFCGWFVVQKHKWNWDCTIYASWSTFQEYICKLYKSHSYSHKIKKKAACCFHQPRPFFPPQHFPEVQLHRSFLMSNSAFGVKLKLGTRGRKLEHPWHFNEGSLSGDFSHSELQTSACCLEFKSNTHIFFFLSPLAGHCVWGEIFCRLGGLLQLNDRSTHKETVGWRPLGSGYPVEPDVFLMQSDICNRRLWVDPLWLFFPSSFQL